MTSFSVCDGIILFIFLTFLENFYFGIFLVKMVTTIFKKYLLKLFLFFWADIAHFNIFDYFSKNMRRKAIQCIGSNWHLIINVIIVLF